MLGGGPLSEDGVLRPICQKYYEEVLGLDIPAVSASEIPVRNIDISRVGNRYFEKLFSITIPIPTIFSIFDYRPIMRKKVSVSR